MAKRKKLQDQNPPRRVEIRGQDHLLAYITPEEAQMLMDNGGAGKAGPMGIPAFFMNEGQTGDFSGNPDSAAADNNNDRGKDGGYDTIGRAAEKDYGAPEPSAQDIEDARGFDFGSEASDALAASFSHGFNQMGKKGLGYNISGQELDRAFGQLDGRMANAKANYGLPGFIGGLLGKIGMFNLENIKSGLQKGYAPAFDKAGNIQGVFGPDPFGFGGLVYSGNPIEGNKATGWSDVDGHDGYEEVKPVNPVTGQCDAGYVYNENMGACIKETPSDYSSSGIYNQYEPGVYATIGLLDQTPQGLLEVAGQPYDFDTANTQFRMQSGTRPQYFTGPYSQEGRTRIG